ncbi:MAG TPA: type II secretion system protein [Gemmatimonadaceae bacterium]|nr:type II secretion system protein [Gemmatimonadaceae bacterium]
MLSAAFGTGRRRGLSLMEVIVALVIIALLAAAVYPTIMPRLRSAQVSAIASQLDNLRIAIGTYRQDVRRHPRRLYQLTHALPPGDLDACGAPVSFVNRNRWDGPYIARSIDGDFPAGDATIRDTLVRNPPTTGGGPLGQLQILVTDVDSATASAVDRQFDGNNDFANGSILWVPAGTLTFQFPISGC